MSAPAASAPPQSALTRHEWALLASAYLSQFVALGFFFMALTAILRGQGVPLAQLGWLYMLGLVPSLKFLWAPLMDRWGFGVRGHYGKWLALMQALLIASLLALSQLPMQAGAAPPMRALVAGSVAIALLTACQDMAADGLSCRLLGPRQRGLGNAVQLAGGLLGFAMGGGGVLMLYEAWGWQVAVLSLTLLNLLPLALALTYREPAHARPVPAARQARMRDYWRQLLDFWRQPRTGWAWALFIASLPVGAGMAYGVLTPMLVDLGWSMGQIGRVVHLYATVPGVIGVLALGLAMRRWSPAHALRWVLPAQALAVALLAAPLLHGAGQAWVLLGVIGYMALYMPLETLAAALMMGRASARAPATDFSMQHGLYSTAGHAAGALALPLAGRFGYGALLLLATGIGLLLCLVAPWLWRRAGQDDPPTSITPCSPSHPA
ncbi:MFS transporter [Vandammella animalimorsus]|nr:MFS transporter [Vandammella animalimorsus]